MVDPAFLLDANICIYILEGRSDRAAKRVSECPIGQLATSAIAYAEVLIGAARQQRLVEALAFFVQVTVLPFDAASAETYAGLPFKRGSYDRLIAAQALSLGLTIVTSNEKDFTGIPGLNVENWTA